MLSQKHRRTIHDKLTPILGEEVTDAFMAEFPASPADEPATKADLERLRVEVRADVQVGMAEMRTEMHNLGRQMVMWSTGSIIGGMGLAAAIAAAFGG